MSAFNPELLMPVGQPIDFDQFPPSVGRAVEETGYVTFDPELEDPRFSDAFTIDFGKDQLFGFQFLYLATNTVSEDRRFWLVDTNRAGEAMGVGLMKAKLTGDGRALPYVGWLETMPDFQRRGLAVRRLRVMNQIANLVFDSNLYSDFNGEIEPEAENLFLKLVKQREAEELVFEGQRLYRLTSTD